MKKIFLLIALTLLAISTASALEPLKLAIFKTGGAANVQVVLNDYTGGTATVIYTGPSVSLTPNSSGIIIINVANNIAATDWADITAAQVNSYYILDVLIGGTLFAQYRLDQQIISQSQGGVFDNNGNLSPSSNGAQNLGNDDNRWGELFVEGNTLHVGPGGGMAGNDELAFSYNDATNTATMTVAGIDELTLNTNGATITGGITANPSGADKDFIFGDDDFDHTSGIESKMFFDKSKGAFRVGNINGTHWDVANVGSFSTAMGYSTTASGISSTAMGDETTASGNNSTATGRSATASGNTSTAMGSSTTASGTASAAMGYQTVANGNYSTAMGSNTIASETSSTAMGFSTSASGNTSTAMGSSTTASGIRATAMGSSTTASGLSSTAIGNSTTASGDISTAMGEGTTAKSYAEAVIGSYNTDYVIATDGDTQWKLVDRLFVIGNGTGTGVNSSDAMIVYKNGDVVVPALGNTTSTQNLQVDANGKLVAGTAAYTTGTNIGDLANIITFDSGGISITTADLNASHPNGTVLYLYETSGTGDITDGDGTAISFTFKNIIMVKDGTGTWRLMSFAQ